MQAGGFECQPPDDCVNPASIDIWGASVNPDGTYGEVDVSFRDSYDRMWYLTLITPDRYMAQILDEIETTLPSDVANMAIGPEHEVKKMVWNGVLTTESTKEILSNTNPSILKDFAVEIEAPEE
ncbi:hypothetical protein KC968_00045 [Candidatus Saccharibacteria bacterium]|nr:hypothetical protein [Candidatus Saccharibacteria bacterium]